MVAPTEAPLDVATADGSISTWSHLTKNRQKYSSPPFVFTIHDRQSPPLTAMSAAGKQPETLTFDSAALYLRFYAAVFSQPPPIPATFPPLPSSLPHPKLIPKTRFIIDGFKHAGEFSVSYFLSHFHSDHYTGLSPAWSKGVIYCSSITARLLVEVLKVPGAFVVPLPCNERVLVDGCEVRLVDANHCPGAVQFLFKVPTDGGKFEKYVHTGDFRYCESMKMTPLLNEFVGSDAVFLDTTYCNPKYVFPAQQESIDYIVEVIDRIGAENEGNAKNVLFLVATYVIGKEKILMEISRRCKRKIHVDARKMNVLSVLGMGESGVFSEDASESDVHVVGWNVLGETWPYFRPNFVSLKEVMEERGYSKVVGFVPTGWTYEVKKTKFAVVRKKDSFEIHLVPYSEHSNYKELREYVKFLNPKRVIPTVGIDVEKLDSKHVDKLTKHFAGLVDVNAAKQEFLMGFYKKAREDDGNDDTSPQQQKAETVSEVDIEDCLKELGDCLPSWVTQSQMVDLLVTSKHNVVEAVSNFYEHETEFYEQVADTLSPPSLHLQDSLPSKLAEDESRTFYKPRGVESGTSAICSPVNVLSKTQGVSVSDRLKQPTIVNTAKNKSSPGKRKRAAENKTSKKVKSTASSGHTPKQHTITKFFQKIAVNVSQDEEAAAASQPSQDDKVAGAPRPSKDDDDTSIPSDTIESFKAVVDQFIHIVNGDESLRRQASMILKKTDGNVNLALDIYYGGSGASIDGNNVSLPEKIGEVQSRSSMKNSFTECENPKLKKLGSASDASIAVQQIDNTATDYVSLPLEKYSPVEHACWKKGEPAPFLHLARTFDLVEEEKGKIKATIMLCNMFRSLLSLSPEDVLPAVYLCLNKIAPDHENMELNIGSSIIVAALEDACGTNKSKVRDMYNSLGDLGDVAQLCRQTQTLLIPPAALTIRGVFYVMRRISSQTGPGSMALKKIFIVNLMRSCREKEMKFLVRMLVRNLRIGAMLKTVLPALAQAVVMNSPEVSGENLKHHLKCLSAAVIEAYNILPHLDVLIASLIEKGIQFSSTTLSMVPGVPIKPMLAKIAHGSSQVLKLFENKAFTCEYKYDGQRAQIHRLEDGSFHIFSRNGDETTAKFPDLLNIMKEACGSVLTSFILDTEVVAVDRKKSNKLMSFQELSSRERGSKDSTVSLVKIKVDICVFIFDIMFMDGKQLLGTTLRERRKYLKDLFGQEKPGYIEYANEMTVEATDADIDNETTTSAINSFLDDALRSSCEGIMVKTLDVDAGYTPSKRSDAWLKVKKDYVEGLNDSLDLVPIGAWHGNGRKAGWYSPFLMACYDPDREEFQSVCRVMSGFSDSFYKEMKEFFSEDKIVAKKPPYYQTAEVPDVWFSAELVWAIRGAELSVSPVHQAAIGLVHPSRGISMRFPRFLRSVSDRNPEDCSTAADIADMFNSQTRKMEVNMKQIKQ